MGFCALHCSGVAAILGLLTVDLSQVNSPMTSSKADSFLAIVRGEISLGFGLREYFELLIFA